MYHAGSTKYQEYQVLCHIPAQPTSTKKNSQHKHKTARIQHSLNNVVTMSRAGVAPIEVEKTTCEMNVRNESVELYLDDIVECLNMRWFI